MKIIFGLCCQSQLNPKISASGTTTLKYLSTLKDPVKRQYLINKAKGNIKSLQELLKITYQNGIKAFRLSDSFVPMADLGLYNIQQELGDALKKAGNVANQLDMRISCHPSQFFLLTSKNPTVIQNSIKSFDVFAKVLDLMKLKHTPIIVTHVGAIKCWTGYEQACDVFCRNFELLSNPAKSFIAVQNDQSSHSINSCMYIHSKINIPVIFDHVHYSFNPVPGISQLQALKMAISTWPKDRTPKIHLSSQSQGQKRHAHGDYVNFEEYKKLKQQLKEAAGDRQVIMMVEVKKKDQAILRLIEEEKTKIEGNMIE